MPKGYILVSVDTMKRVMSREITKMIILKVGASTHPLGALGCRLEQEIAAYLLWIECEAAEKDD